ncbi:MBL fold metallo-hydrolase [Marinobacter salinexigens]|jgi:hydroxyacylglutathione hydrolase|uniref:hydroxyacylglutathione hydrolase n=1 Tax=Marinobacter salinexigens TaxID=2919747 RepID=A0A5B0VF01_9GAMM|nr:hydroxyacylglutathione hydrolase C-terminal domain-containing protein [Marinobacter salinexigens]KAA1173266.1 MBL fold metallo-hydrolase [Marinobacter salinexigens]|tara:strand:- start:2136 stop:2930 length:795 start_codon:yes stop_codon:yes gene_type:complete
MKIIRHFVDNALRNYNYLIACEASRFAVAVDPLDTAGLLKIAAEHGLSISHIINTHEHSDHIAGNPTLKRATGAVISAHSHAAKLIPGVDNALNDGDQITLGNLDFRVLHTPGHTAAHICLLVSNDGGTSTQALFSGDALFNAAAGNCKNDGNVHQLFDSFERVFSQLHDDVLLYPGHDYLLNNLNFALSCDPLNKVARRLQAKLESATGHTAPVMSLGDERQYNPFLRLTDSAVQEKVSEAFPATSLSPRDIFVGLRKLRDAW